MTIEVGGHTVRVTSADRVIYPSTGMTKADVIAYYRAIADTMLPHVRDRALTRKRWPEGVGEDGTGASFFQKDLGGSAPDWVPTNEIQHRDHVNTYPLVNEEATLVWLGQISALELHVPQWRFGEDGAQLDPDRLVFDLDPGDDVSLRHCAQIAFRIRRALRDEGLDSIPATSGGKGIHVYAPLDGSMTPDDASALAKDLTRRLETERPDEVTSAMKRSERGGRVFIDWSQNNVSKTTVAPYSLRGRIRPTVAAPRTWHELASPQLRQLEYAEALTRVARRGDPLASV